LDNAPTRWNCTEKIRKSGVEKKRREFYYRGCDNYEVRVNILGANKSLAVDNFRGASEV
jgi:hypothetical protein